VNLSLIVPNAALRKSAIPTLLALLALGSAVQPRLFAADAPGTVSISDFQSRLRTLDQLVAQCQSSIIAANCQSSQVGPDLKVALPSGPRAIRFAWLRALLDAAADSRKNSPAKTKSAKAEDDSDDSDAETSKPPEFQPPTIPQQLADARQRLAAEAQLAANWAQPTGQPAAASGKTSPTPQRQTLDRILAAKEFHPAVVGPSLIERALEKIGNWIDRLLGLLGQAGFKSKWVGRTAEILFILALTVGLVWFLIRLERQGRLASAYFLAGTGGAAASARDWQLWLEDARRAAAQSAWRDAIHLLYWASISRLESSGLWPADRARTPREYLAILTQENVHHADLKALTRSFERTWYAGRPAAEADFRHAAEVAARLGIPSNSDRGPR
jgi:hypothetical protein